MNETRISEVGPDALPQYQSIPISFLVDSIFHVTPVHGGLGGLTLAEEPVEHPYVKDYDDDHEEGLTRWAKRFDVSRWLFLMAFDGEIPAGGATVAFRSPGVDMLRGRDDLAVLWDLRVRPEHRGKGIGSALFRYATAWASGQGCTQLKIETQNVNVRACRFYASQGCVLGAIDRYAYANSPRVAHETMLHWYLDLQHAACAEP